MKKVAILQSNYIPWKGYFDLIASVDEFIFYDEMQYTKNDWRNRNLIKTKDGLKWLTIPVKTKGHISNFTRINEAAVASSIWSKKHLKTIEEEYSKAKFFEFYVDKIRELYYKASYLDKLCEINYEMIYFVLDVLEINTKISFSQDYGLIEGKTERLIDLVQKAQGKEYISGPAAKDYIKEELFFNNNIKLSWMSYENYPTYKQLHGDFVHNVSILDLILNCGPHSKDFFRHRQ